MKRGQIIFHAVLITLLAIAGLVCAYFLGESHALSLVQFIRTAFSI